MKNDSTLLKTPKCVLPNMTSFSRHLGVIARFHHHAAQPSSNATQRTTWGTTAQSRHESNRGQPSTRSIGNLHHESSWWATNIYQPYHTHGHPIQWPFLMVNFPLIIMLPPPTPIEEEQRQAAKREWLRAFRAKTDAREARGLMEIASFLWGNHWNSL